MITFDVHIEYTINQSINNVFDAVVDAEKLSSFFTTKASHNITNPETITWDFSDYDCSASLEIKITQVVIQEKIEFIWSATGKEREVIIDFKSIDANNTQISITEKKFDYTPEDVARALDQKQGWTDFVCALKAYLHSGINLRKC